MPGRIPPHLDASARGPKGAVAIESKCLEYFTPKAAEFSPGYRQLRQFETSPWYWEMERLRSTPDEYKVLDVAQLVKHAFGLMNSAGAGATLVYAFWEPEDANAHRLFAEHREEIALLDARTRNDRLSFVSIAYPELWSLWMHSGSDSLAEHANCLFARYGGRLGSYEGYARVNGRKTDAHLFDLGSDDSIDTTPKSKARKASNIAAMKSTASKSSVYEGTASGVIGDRLNIVEGKSS